MKILMDIVLIISGLLLIGTASAYFMGYFVYPFGFLILLLFFVARILYIQQRNRGRIK